MSETSESERRAREQREAAVFIFTGLALMFGALVIFVFMCFHWLKVGDWPKWSLAALGYLPGRTQFLGLNKIIAWAYREQLAYLSLILGVLLAAAGAFLGRR